MKLRGLPTVEVEGEEKRGRRKSNRGESMIRTHHIQVQKGYDETPYYV
jgi:hypothetical protein